MAGYDNQLEAEASTDAAVGPELAAELPALESTGTQPTRLIHAAGLSYFPVAFVARLPFAMMVVGVLTLVVAARGSIALGGITSAAVGLGTALLGPVLGMAVDRFGQRRVVLVAAIGNSLALLAFAWAAFAPVPDLALLGVAFLVGATAPQVSPLSRSRLVGIIQTALPRGVRAKTLNGTMAYESAADEIVFVFGPVIVGLLATTMNPAAPIIGAAVLTLIFVTAFAFHKSSRVASDAQTTDAAARAPFRELLKPRMLVLVLGVLGMGFFFGAMLTALTAFMDEVARPEEAGVLYGVMGIGSAILALSAAAFSPRFSMRARWLVFSLALVAGAVIAASATTIPVMILALALGGIGVGPTLVTIYGLVAARTPAGRSATAMTIAGSAIIVGQASSSAFVGILAEDAGAQLALLVPLAAALVVLLAGATNWVISSRDATR
ncbi:MFS transporter [Microterricola viridarii]|uniref:Predicted arabinose efflux permease, MFS family n=1 Tax=Microterricola viridarii TaxID=412690 RepID=A0A1H1WBM5_9MICO|nr:MFS transporter [Microterricola viridarii]SDS93806.1 Predicted arabinose efflux permease, MFS family [Microterricola viridarii]